MLLLVLVVATGVMIGQNVVDISYNWDKENNICVTADPLNLSTIMEGEWSGPGVMDNVFYPTTIPVGSTTKIVCNDKEFLMVVHPSPYVSLGWTPKELKAGSQPIQLTGYPQGGKWYVNGYSFDGNFDPKEAGVYEFLYTLTDDYGCTAATATYIQVR